VGLGEALGRQSWAWAVLAGAAAGAAEWFRTGTLPLFAVPCAVHGLVCLWQRDWGRLGITGVALTAFGVIVALGGRAAPSRVDKTVANLWHNLAESEGPFLTENVPDLGWVTYSMGGYRLVPGTAETANDAIVRRSREVGVREFVTRHADTLLAAYRDRLGEVVHGRAWGLRWMVHELLLACFLFQVVASLMLADATARTGLPIAAGALAYYLGPVVLLRGDQPTHYLLLALPLFLLVAARGAESLVKLAANLCGPRNSAENDARPGRESPAPRFAGGMLGKRGLVLAMVLAPVVVLCANFYRAVLTTLHDYQLRAEAEQAAVDALPLAGRTVACRNMSWFVDRDVRTILLPYATVAELEGYVRAHGIDGILVWDNETQLYFRATPYGSLKDFDRALRQSPVFDAPHVSGAWRWYPVRRAHLSRRRP
jgi:hypothetical protein